MSKKIKENTISLPSAEAKEGIYAENADISNPQSGDTNSFDAGSEETKMAEFEALIKGKYKKQFSEKVQSIIRRRLKEVKNLDNTAKKEINEKVDNENMKNSNAEEKYAGIIKRLMVENSFLKKDRESRLRDAGKSALSERLRTQAEEAKAAYPEFDIAKELENPEFGRLIRSGVSVKNAYEVMNIDRIMEDKVKDTEKKVLETIRLKGSRPVENGSETGGGILLSNNISKLGKKERAELARRAARGEKIEF